MTVAPLRLRNAADDKAEGELIGKDGQFIEVLVPVAQAPGQPVTFDVALDGGEFEVQGKSLGSKLQLDGRFLVRLRLMNLRRETREALEARFGG